MSSSRDRTADKLLSTRCMPTAEPWRVSEQSLQFFYPGIDRWRRWILALFNVTSVQYIKTTWKKGKITQAFSYFYKSKIVSIFPFSQFSSQSDLLQFNYSFYLTYFDSTKRIRRSFFFQFPPPVFIRLNVEKKTYYQERYSIYITKKVRGSNRTHPTRNSRASSNESTLRLFLNLRRQDRGKKGANSGWSVVKEPLDDSISFLAKIPPVKLKCRRESIRHSLVRILVRFPLWNILAILRTTCIHV